jgi:hypothetical protein
MPKRYYEAERKPVGFIFKEVYYALDKDVPTL